MSRTISDCVDWTPEVLPCAPRPINGELLSSWARRLAAANGIALPEIGACVGDLMGREKAGMFDYAAPKWWRLAMASMARIPERWIWALDLQQQFPAMGREWFLHDPAHPEQIAAAFCPECFHEQAAGRRFLHLQAEWTLALVTRCLRHQLPLYRYCPWCGKDQPVHFEANAVRCLYCERPLTVRPWVPTPDDLEPGIAAFQRAVVEMLAGAAPDPVWAAGLTPRSFRALLMDLIWMLTTQELMDPSYSCALVDRIAPDRFLPKYAYGEDFETAFYARSWAEREAVVSVIVQILLGPEADRYVGVRTCFRSDARPWRPFVEILRSVQRHPDRLWERVGHWPGFLQDRAQNASRLIESEQSTSQRRHRKRRSAVS